MIKIKSIKNINYNHNIFLRKRGTTAFVYKKNDDEVLKVYRNTWRKRRLFDTGDMLSILNRLSDIKLDSFVTPNDIYVDFDLNLLGYSMDRVKGTRLDRINSLMDMKTILEYAKKLEEDNKILSDYKFKLLDLHESNMFLTEDGYKVFDLDCGYFETEETKDRIYYYNNKLLKQCIIKGLFGICSCNNIFIKEEDIRNAYYNDSISEAIEAINDSLNVDELTAYDVKILSRRFVEINNSYNVMRAYF